MVLRKNMACDGRQAAKPSDFASLVTSPLLGAVFSRAKPAQQGSSRSGELAEPARPERLYHQRFPVSQKFNVFVILHKFLSFRNFCKVCERFLQIFTAQNSIPWNDFSYPQTCFASAFRSAELRFCLYRAAI